ncbi:hypothetical protein PP178_04660 [Zeaxanthinibacter sp. PT1]|uniref:hypothetical protein n=1 Tax=Zeaxanthinibacter TaxID=561554 RepID=UPI00234A5CC8|nr:hypothetical protein [Zeaxanthinibacter sp. PT1]MDC6350832.1 hypothetical protein [Zeaxanthinibacter sp. PT1]
MTKIFLHLVLFSFVLSQCNGKQEQDSSASCDGIMCTQQFVSFSVSIKDSDGNSLALDEYKVIDLHSGKDLTESVKASGFYDHAPSGPYPLYSDSFQKEHQNTERELLFKGYFEGEEIISRTYKVAADCCHVQLLKGELEIIL